MSSGRRDFLKKRTCVVGAGSWGTTFADMLSRASRDVTLIARNESVVFEITENRTNNAYLPGIRLDNNLKAQALSDGIPEDTEMVFIAVPSKWLREVCKCINEGIREGVKVISLMKGIEIATQCRMSEIICQEIENVKTSSVAVLSGPNHAEEIAAGKPAAAVIASDEPRLAAELQRFVSNERFRVYVSNDIRGVETAGAYKNVIAIAAGMSDALEMGENAKAALITRGLAEIVRFGLSKGGLERTFYGLSGAGDLIATCGSGLSRNWKLGSEVVNRGLVSNGIDGKGMVAEGYYTVQSIKENAQNEEYPISEAVYEILFRKADPGREIERLMNRPLKHE